MLRRNLFFDIELTDAQWDQLERTADTPGAKRGFHVGARTEEPYAMRRVRVLERYR